MQSVRHQGYSEEQYAHLPIFVAGTRGTQLLSIFEEKKYKQRQINQCWSFWEGKELTDLQWGLQHGDREKQWKIDGKDAWFAWFAGQNMAVCVMRFICLQKIVL